MIFNYFYFILLCCFLLLAQGEENFPYPFPENFTLAVNRSAKFITQFYERRRLMEEHLKASHHHESWKLYAEVNGLKNTEVAVFITSSTVNNEELIWER